MAQALAGIWKWREEVQVSAALSTIAFSSSDENRRLAFLAGGVGFGALSRLVIQGV